MHANPIGRECCEASVYSAGAGDRSATIAATKSLFAFIHFYERRCWVSGKHTTEQEIIRHSRL
eukprot:1663935-Pyramimonas_sp.AAC.1